MDVRGDLALINSLLYFVENQGVVLFVERRGECGHLVVEQRMIWFGFINIFLKTTIIFKNEKSYSNSY